MKSVRPKKIVPTAALFPAAANFGYVQAAARIKPDFRRNQRLDLSRKACGCKWNFRRAKRRRDAAAERRMNGSPFISEHRAVDAGRLQTTSAEAEKAVKPSKF